MIRKLFSLVVLFVLFYGVFVPVVRADDEPGDYTIIIDDWNLRDNWVEVEDEVWEAIWTLDHDVFADISILGFGDECMSYVTAYNDGEAVYTGVVGFPVGGRWFQLSPDVAFDEIRLHDAYPQTLGCAPRLVVSQSWNAAWVPVGDVMVEVDGPPYITTAGDPGRMYVEADMPPTMTSDTAVVWLFDEDERRVSGSYQEVEIREGYTDLGEATSYVENGFISIEGNLDGIAFGGHILDEVDLPGGAPETELYTDMMVYGQFALWIYSNQDDAYVMFRVYGQDEEYDYLLNEGWNEFEFDSLTDMIYIESQTTAEPIRYAMLVLGNDYEPDFEPVDEDPDPGPEPDPDPVHRVFVPVVLNGKPGGQITQPAPEN